MLERSNEYIQLLFFPGDIDPNSVFQAFFAEPGGSQFSFTSGSFPSGFTFQFG
jgi:hypothetical protein